MTNLIVKNKINRSEYDIHSSYECGISLLGWEVKSIRAKNVKLDNAFCSISNKNELFLNNCNISQYMLVKCEPTRTRKLLMHKHEILKIKNLQDRLGLILIPMSLYWSENHIKLEISLAKRLRKFDKREKIKKLEAERSIKKNMF
ncbi:SsrA-binding protein SmpB [[Mycoplasma] anseris]|uniref:SsrA-binding protein n=1 Tax=[Mycoplasma] anseris TaxID=92400 RepID=A0A2Z4NDS4_9BACT|nr:SsrA-binding protein SmpB [[Mycoplasma] anseris]AWX69743.1 SsrA-binding protein SmpB [[Mycoplasma] anseris]